MPSNQDDIFFQNPPLGEAVIETFILPPNANVESTEIELAGGAFVGNLNQEQLGTTVHAAGSGGDATVFIVDFHALRSIFAVSPTVGSKTVTAVYMWFGTNFFASGTMNSINANLLTNNASTQAGLKHFEEVTATKIKVTLNQALPLAAFKNNFQVIGRSFPLNLRAKIGSEDPFWAYPGEFASRSSLPAFVETLNRLKQSCKNGECGFPLVLASEAPGRVDLHKKKIGFHLDKVFLDGNEIAKLELEANTEATLRVSSPPIGAAGGQIHLAQLGFDLQGVISSSLGVKVSPTFSAAIRILPDQDLQAQGFKILLGKELSPDLELFAEVQADKDGQPFAEKVLASAPIKIAAKEIEQDFWLEAVFEAAVALTTGKTYWVVLKSKNGTAEWKAHLQTTPAQRGEFKFSKNAAATWQDHNVAGFFLLESDPPLTPPQQFLPVTLRLQGASQAVQAKDVAEAIPPFVLATPAAITLDAQGRFDLDLAMRSALSGHVQVTKAFAKYFVAT